MSKRGSGRNKSRMKKREYKEHCRIMRTSGQWTTAGGTWTDNKSVLGPEKIEKKISETTRK